MSTKTYSIKNQNTSPRSRKWLFFAVGGAVLIATVITFLAITHTDNIIGTKKSNTKTASQATKGEPANGSTTGSQSSGSTTTTTDDKQNTTTDASDNTPATQPSGNFVSNYAPSLSATGAKEQIQSVCNTTPGAACTISFTNGTTTKSLEKRVTDKGGSVYWTWALKDIGLSTGSWKITATAELNNQKTVTTDTLPLEVQP